MTDQAPTSRSARHERVAIGLALAALLPLLGACGSDSAVLGAVFGVEGAQTAPYQLGRVPQPELGPGDRLIGLAASDPALCIYSDEGTARRFRAACPDGFGI